MEITTKATVVITLQVIEEFILKETGKKAILKKIDVPEFGSPDDGTYRKVFNGLTFELE